jgi:hypothetical protein
MVSARFGVYSRELADMGLVMKNHKEGKMRVCGYFSKPKPRGLKGLRRMAGETGSYLVAPRAGRVD